MLKRILPSLLFCLLLALPAVAQGSGGNTARPSGFFAEPGAAGDTTASYLTLGTSSGLDNERVLTFSDNFNVVDNGSGNTFTVDLATVPLTDGGTGATTQQGAVNAILNFAGKATGNIVYFNGTNWVVLAAGSDSEVLTLSGGVPTWSAGSSGAPADSTFIVQSLSASLSNERVLTGTANRITVTDGGANGNMTLDIGTDVVTLTGTQTLTNKTLTSPAFSWNAGAGASLQASTFNSTLLWADWGAARQLTIPDPGTDASFVMTAGNQTIAGTKTFSSAPTLSSGTLTAGANLMTFPSTAQTLVGRTSTDTLTNKTLTSPIIGTSMVLDQVTQDYTLTWNNPAAARAYTIRDVSTDAHFAMTTTTATYTAGGIAYGNGNVMLFTSAGSAGQPLLSQGTSPPVFGTLAATAGGTGLTSYTTGQILYSNATNVLTRLNIGSTGQALIVSGGLPAWGVAAVAGGGTSFSTYTTGDMLYASATNTLAKRAIGTTGQVLTVSGGVPTWATPTASATGALVGGRLTTSSTQPVADGGAALILYYLPYIHNKIDLYYNSQWNTCTFSSILVSYLSTAANTVYDVFVYDTNTDGVADTLDLVAWTNDTTRATALATQDSVYVKSGATNRRYVGTIRTTASPRFNDDSTNRAIYNYYNQVPRTLVDSIATSSYTYASTTWRAAGASASSIYWLNGNPVSLSPSGAVYGSTITSGSKTAYVGIGLDSSSSNTAYPYGVHTGSGANDLGQIQAVYWMTGSLGYHYVTLIEKTDGSSMTYYGSPSGGGSLFGVIYQ